MDALPSWASEGQAAFLDNFKKDATELYNMKRKPLKAKPKPTINGRLLHTSLYMSAFGYGDTDFIPSELSGDRAVDIHHIQNRGLGSTKTEDRIENLMGLSREEHMEFGDKKHLMAFLYRRHMEFMIYCGVKFDRAWIEGEIERWSAEEKES